jgi:hypothetical protein
MKIYALLMIAFTLSSCASMSKEECVSANWKEVGIKDGSLGRNALVFNDYVKSCAKTSATPDQSAYMSGRSEGLKTYCTIQKGYDKGRHNENYYGTCVDHNEKIYLDGRKLGLELYEQERLYTEAVGKVKKMDDDIAQVQNEIENLGAAARQKDLTSQQRNEKETLISYNKVNLSAFKHRRSILQEQSEEAFKNFDALKKKHDELGYCSNENCFMKK